jgi:TonB family protein
MPVHGGILAVVCGSVVLAGAPLARAQDATSANLPDRVETDEVAPRPSPKKRKPQPSREIAARTLSHKPVPVPEQTPAAEEPARSARVEKKSRGNKPPGPVVQPATVSFPAAASLSLSAAQAMAVSAPLPEYPYQAKHGNISGSGVCVMIVDSASGKVTNAMMAQSTGNAILDKVTTETFRRWRFKPGNVSQIRVPITYE